jgi:hypothetical protein
VAWDSEERRSIRSSGALLPPSRAPGRTDETTTGCFLGDGEDGVKSLTLYNGDVTLEFNGGRHIYTANGKYAPSATGIIGIMSKPGLEAGNWAADAAVKFLHDRMLDLSDDNVWHQARKAHKMKKDKAADVGTRVHKFAQEVMDGETDLQFPSDPQGRAGATAFLNWYHKNHVQAHATERMVYSRKHHYAGTADFVGLVNGERCILDFKTSNYFASPYLAMRLQKKAYAMAIEEELGCEPITTGWTVRLDKESGLPDPHRVELTDDHGELFRGIRAIYDLYKRLDKEIYSEQLSRR